MCQHLRRRHLTPAPLTLRLQFSQPALYLIRHRRIEQVFHDHIPPLNESNQEPVSEKGHFSAVTTIFALSRSITCPRSRTIGTLTLSPPFTDTMTVATPIAAGADTRSSVCALH